MSIASLAQCLSLFVELMAVDFRLMDLFKNPVVKYSTAGVAPLYFHAAACSRSPSLDFCRAKRERQRLIVRATVTLSQPPF